MKIYGEVKKDIKKGRKGREKEYKSVTTSHRHSFVWEAFQGSGRSKLRKRKKEQCTQLTQQSSHPAWSREDEELESEVPWDTQNTK